MAGEFEVTKLYAKIVPKLSTTFKSDLQKQINVATKTSQATARIKVEVAQGSLTAATKKIESTLSKAKAKVKLDIDNASIAKANKALLTLKNKTVKVKVELTGYEVAKKKLDLLTRDRKVEIKTDLDKNFVAQIARLGALGGRGRGSIGGIAGSVDNLGRAFGRMSDLAGVAGVVVSGVARVIGGLTGIASSAGEGAGGFAASLGKVAASAASALAVSAVVGVVLAVVAAFAVGTLAAAGFAIAAVVLGAVVTALAVGLGALAAAASAAIGILSGLAAVVGVLAAALIPVAQAFGEFINVQGEAPKVTNAAGKAVKNQAKTIQTSAAAVRSATRAYKDAQHAVADAAYGIVRANRAVRDAGYNLKESYRNQLKARERLNDAEEKAKKNLKDLARAARDASGREEDAEIALIRARERLAELDPFADDQTDYREALRDVEQAERDLADTREDNKDTLKEYEEAKKKGVKGDQDVIDAAQGVKDADHEALLAKEALTDAERAAKEAKYDHTRAIEGQRDALLALKEAQTKQKDALVDTTTAIDTSTAAQRKYGKQYAELTPAGQAFVETLKEIYGWFQKLSGIAQEAVLPGFGEALENLKVLRPLVEEYVKKIGESLGDLAVRFSKIFTSKEGQEALRQLAEASKTTIEVIGESLAKSVETLLPSLANLAEKSAPLIQAFGAGLETVSSGLAAMFDSFSKPEVVAGMSALVTTITNVIGQTLARFGQFMENISKTLGTASPRLNDGLDKLVDGLFDTLEALINSGLLADFGDFMGLIGETLSELSSNGFFRELGATMGEALKVIGQGIKDLFSDPKVITDFVELFQLMPGLIKTLIDTLPILLPAFLQFISASSKFTDKFGPGVLKSIASLLGGLSLALDGVSVAANGLSSAFNFLGELFQKAVVIGAQIVAGLIQGIGPAFAGFLKFVGSLFKGFIDFVKSLLGIHSPSTVFAEIGSFLMQGFLNGIKAGWKLVTTFFSTVFDFLTKTFPGYFKTAVENVKRAWVVVKTRISEVWSSVVTTVWTPIKTFLTGTGETKGSLANYFFQAVVAIKTAFSVIKTRLSEVWTTVKSAVWTPIYTFLTGSGDTKGSLANYFAQAVVAVKNAFAVIKTKLSEIWKGVKDNVFTPIKTFLTGGASTEGSLASWFKKGVDAVGKAWEKIRAIAKAPIAFVVNTVYNDGIRKVWNGIAGKVGLGNLDKIEGFAKGGILPGTSGFRGKDDRIANVKGGGKVALAGGEMVVNAKQTKKNKGILKAINAGLDIPGFAGGGIIGDLFDKVKNAGRGLLGAAVNPALNALLKALPAKEDTLPGAIKSLPRGVIEGIKSFINKDDKANANTVVPGNGSLSGGTGYLAQIANLAHAGFNLRFANTQLTGGTHSKTSNHYLGRAIDIGVGTNGQGQVEKVWQYLVANYAKSSRELYWKQKAVNYRHGQEIGPTDGYDHIHWAMNKGGLVSGLGGALGDKVKRYLSPGEFVMTQKATKAIGTRQLADANRMANGGGSPSKIRGSMKLANAQLDGGGSRQTPTYVDQRKTINMKVNVQNRQQVDTVRNKIQAIL